MPAKSKNQQKLFGMALAYKRGELKDANDDVKQLAASMSEQQLKDYASTNRKNLPNKKASFTFDQFSNIVKKAVDNNSAKTMQKDWIVYDFEKGNLFCIAIESKDNGNTWKLIEFVNYFELPDAKLQEMVSNGYNTMFVAKNKHDGYEWIIADHKFTKEEFDKKDYWKNLVPEDKLHAFATLSAEIDKSEFEKEMKTLVPESKFSGK